MLKPRLYASSDVYILLSGTIAVAALATGGTNNNVEVVFKSCAPFTECISKLNNTQIDNAKDIYIGMPMYNLIEYSNSYYKTSGILCQYYRHESVSNNAGSLESFLGNSASFKFKQKITGSTGDDCTKNVKLMVSLIYVSTFWKYHELIVKLISF